MNDKEIGRLGESLAANFLIQKGMVLLARNLKNKFGEIDLLMRQGEQIVVVEVKSGAVADLNADGLYRPLDRVTDAKQRKLQMLAQVVAQQYSDRNVRVDVVEVRIDQVSRKARCEHLENVLEG